MSTTTRSSEWEAWAARELAAYPERQAAAVQAAVEALDRGLSPRTAAAAAWASAGAPLPAADLGALWEELQALDRMTAELEAIKPSGDLTEAGIRQLVSAYQARLQATREIYAAAREAAGPAAPAAQVKVQGAPSPPGPSLREFFADNSILIISIAGAILLIVSTLLFEIYGASGFGAEAQFGAVLALNLVFGAAGYICLGRARLRLVGHTYLAIFALMAPLTVAAAWVFLDLSSRGITPEDAVGYGGLACAALYAILGARLASRAYAALSLLALAVGYGGVIASAPSGVWAAAWFALLAFAYVAIADPPASSPRALVPFTRVAEPFIHAAALAALGWSAQLTAVGFGESAPQPSFQVSVTLGVLALAYAGHAWRSRRPWMLGFVWAGATFAALAAVNPLGWGANGYVLDLVVLAWVYAIGARWMPGRGLRGFVRAGAAIQAGFAVLPGASPDWLQAAALLAASGVGLLFALEDGLPAWLLLTVGVFTVDWFWIVKSLVPPPPNPNADALLMAYSPLPVLYAVAGLALRFTRRPRWAWPLYAGSGLVALGVAAGAAGNGDLTLAGRALAVYALLAYAVAAIHRWWPVMLAALLGAASAVGLLLASADAATYWYPLALAGLAWAVYAARRPRDASHLGRTHRFTALGLACGTALACFVVPDLWEVASHGSLASLAALGAAAAMVFVDGRLNRLPVSDYAAPGIASLAGIWVARYTGASNLQAYVALPGVALIALGLVAAQDARRPAPLNACRASIVAGGAVLLGASAYQSVTEDAAAFYTVLWVVESVAALLVGIGTRSRTLVLVGAAGLASGSLRALFLILESVQVYVVFGAIALLLLAGAGVLAATRDRLSAARTSVRSSWDQWT